MKLPWQKIFLIGIGGAGMTPLAQLLNGANITINGSDQTTSKNTILLNQENISISIGHQDNLLDKTYDLIIYSAAIKPDNPILQQAKKLNIPTIKRGLFLPQLAEHFDHTIAITGSHGKSTVTALLVHLCKHHHLPISYLIGAQPKNIPAGAYYKNDYLILEIDESDTSFAKIKSTIGIIINADYDHDWNIGGQEKMRQLFQTFANQSQKLFITQDTPNYLYKKHPNSQIIQPVKQLDLPLYGEHNQLNATIALHIANQISPTPISQKSYANFQGLNRRMSTIYSDDNYTIIEDYAHHPKELTCCIEAIRQQFPQHHIQLIFQPHRYERTKKHLNEFIQLFIHVQQTFITPIFSAWADKEQKIDWGDIPKTQIFTENNWQEIATQAFKNRPDKKCLTLIVGAATIEQIIPHFKQLILQQKISLPVQTDQTWQQLTTASIGTTIPYLYQPENTHQLKELLQHAHQLKLPYKLICCGSNLIGTDNSYSGIVIHLTGEFNNIEILPDNHVIVGAGVRLTRLVKILSDNNLGGGEILIAIPGGIGGSIRMNAGAQQKEISDFLIEIYGLDPNGKKWHKKTTQINWSYRASDIPSDIIITGAKMKFHHEPSLQTKEKIDQTRHFRKSTQPGGKNAGCTFINPFNDSSGRLIDKYQLKNTLIGDIIVSNKHANFLINQGSGSVQQLKKLINKIRQDIFNHCGIILKLENHFIDDWQPQTIKPYKITLLKGGTSAEREISLKTGDAIAEALKSTGHQVTEIDITQAELPLISIDTDIVFLALHGEFGEDGQIQQLLEDRAIPFIGCDAETSRLTINKYKTNQFLQQNNFHCPQSISLQKENYTLPDKINFPIIIKPQTQGSTIGLTLVKKEEELQDAIDTAFQVDDIIMIEQFIQGHEVTVGLLHNNALPIVEIIPPNEIFDYQAKYTSIGKPTQYLCPAQNISAQIQKRMRHIGEQIFKLIKAKDLIRIDMIYRPEDDKIFIIEINTLPGFTSTSLLPMAAKQNGISFSELCSLIVHQKLQHKKDI